MDIPLRLLDCLGLIIPFDFLVVPAEVLVVVDLRFCGGGGGGLDSADSSTGDDKKADGEGIVIVSILMALYRETWASTEPFLFPEYTSV